MIESVIIRGVEYNIKVKWTEKSFADIWNGNRKIKSCMKVAKDRDKAFKEDWEKLQSFLPKKIKKEEAE